MPANTRRTEIGDLIATWRMSHHCIEIVNVHSTSHGTGPTQDVTFPPGTDLAEAREQHPHWAHLWDAIRHQFWTAHTPPHTTASPQ
ncbi:hypothetical protein BJY24_001356 [Nocardia transvalensis]|uniref:Uncharacterized protein n=1 Tax=Nocardia transvalensis TaxID=37333 RepID=A0A7W9PAH6_9NOCA|nr:hypothetical protein [Nocardia transvalensis]